MNVMQTTNTLTFLMHPNATQATAGRHTAMGHAANGCIKKAPVVLTGRSHAAPGVMGVVEGMAEEKHLRGPLDWQWKAGGGHAASLLASSERREAKVMRSASIASSGKRVYTKSCTKLTNAPGSWITALSYKRSNCLISSGVSMHSVRQAMKAGSAYAAGSGRRAAVMRPPAAAPQRLRAFRLTPVQGAPTCGVRDLGCARWRTWKATND